ncbi:MAG TPA: periplasmic heavy metal sensor [Labilithrix sp.]
MKRLFLRRRFGGGCGGRARWGHHRGWSRGGGIGGSFWLRAIFSRLDTTPGQEKEIRSALEDLRKTARESKESLGASREAVARAVRHETFDEIAIGEATVKADAAAGQVKQAFEAALRRIHAVLDPKQRERLAELLEKGPRGFGGGGGGWGGPYRTQEI